MAASGPACIVMATAKYSNQTQWFPRLILLNLGSKTKIRVPRLPRQILQGLDAVRSINANSQ